MSNELIVYCIGTFVHFFSFFFFFFPFEVFRCTKCKFVLVLRIFFLAQTSCRSNFEFRPVFTETSRNRPKWPEIFSKWNRNTLNWTNFLESPLIVRLLHAKRPAGRFAKGQFFILMVCKKTVFELFPFPILTWVVCLLTLKIKKEKWG